MSENHRHPGTRSCSVWAWLRTAYGWSPCSAGRRRWPSAWSWAVRWENGLPGGLTSGWAGAPRLRVWILRGPVCGREPRRNFLRGSRFFVTLPRRPPSCPYRSYSNPAWKRSQRARAWRARALPHPGCRYPAGPSSRPPDRRRRRPPCPARPAARPRRPRPAPSGHRPRPRRKRRMPPTCRGRRYTCKGPCRN